MKNGLDFMEQRACMPKMLLSKILTVDQRSVNHQNLLQLTRMKITINLEEINKVEKEARVMVMVMKSIKNNLPNFCLILREQLDFHQ